MPFPIREFPFHVLQPCSAKFNDSVERTNGMFRYEFYHSYSFGYSIGNNRNDLKSFNKKHKFHKAV